MAGRTTSLWSRRSMRPWPSRICRSCSTCSTRRSSLYRTTGFRAVAATSATTASRQSVSLFGPTSHHRSRRSVAAGLDDSFSRVADRVGVELEAAHALASSYSHRIRSSGVRRRWLRRSCARSCEVVVQRVSAGHRSCCERSGEGAFGAHRNPRLMLAVGGRRGEVIGRGWWWRSRGCCVRGAAMRGLGC